MRFLSKQYERSFSFLRGTLGTYIRNTSIAFVVIILIAYVLCLFVSDVMNGLVDFFSAVVESSDIVDENGGFSAASIFANNLSASAMSIVYGIIPLIRLPALAIGLNASVLGAVAALYQTNGISLLIFFTGLLPHGIFEFPALMIAFGEGLYLCAYVTQCIRRRPGLPAASETVIDLGRVYITVVVPLLFLASLMEAYVTPLCVMYVIQLLGG